jgi:hypothetical protein
MIDLDLFKPWLDHLAHYHRQWFAKSIDHIANTHSYILHETNETTVWDGKPITFRKDDCFIILSRAINTESMDLHPGIILQNEVASFEVSISVNTPLEVVFCAVKYFNNNEE